MSFKNVNTKCICLYDLNGNVLSTHFFVHASWRTISYTAGTGELRQFWGSAPRTSHLALEQFIQAVKGQNNY